MSLGVLATALTMGAEERIAGSDGAALYTVDSVVSVVSHSIYKSSADRLKQAAQLASSYLQNACYKLYDNRHNPQREKHAAAPQPAARNTSTSTDALTPSSRYQLAPRRT
jgi:hypothetical protein